MPKESDLSRRGFAAATLAGGALASVSAPAAAPQKPAADKAREEARNKDTDLGAGARPAAPTLEFVFQATVTLGPPAELGARDGGRKRFVPITGGTIGGPRLSGVVLPGGGDWQEIGSDGVTDIHARYLLRADDGTVIGVDNPGVRVAPPEIIARLTAGEDLDPALYYFRTTPRFDVVTGPHDWLRRQIFVAQGIRHPATVEIRFFAVA